MLDAVKRLLCWIFQHDPKGPIADPLFTGIKPVYQCRRCSRLIHFDDRGGWTIWRNLP